MPWLGELGPPGLGMFAAPVPASFGAQSCSLSRAAQGLEAKVYQVLGEQKLP